MQCLSLFHSLLQSGPSTAATAAVCALCTTHTVWGNLPAARRQHASLSLPHICPHNCSPVPWCAAVILLVPMLRWSRPTPQEPQGFSLIGIRLWCQKGRHACTVHRFYDSGCGSVQERAYLCKYACKHLYKHLYPRLTSLCTCLCLCVWAWAMSE